MTFAEYLAVMFFSWFSGYVIGYQVRQIRDALLAS